MKLKLISIVLLAVMLLCGCQLLKQNSNELDGPPNGGQDGFSDGYLSYRRESNRDFSRAIWVSYLDLAAVISADETVYRANLGGMLDNLETLSITDVFFQLRAFGDSLYPSGVYPSAKLTTYPSLGEYDAFSIVIELFHARGIAVHAWLNPFRLHTGEGESYQAFIDGLVSQDEDCVGTVGEGRYLNPASDVARQLVLDGVAEILERYDVDGIHLDDYFYPTEDAAYDATYYGAYCASGGTQDLASWRRGNVTKLVGDIYELVKDKNEIIRFGISPDASIERNMTKHYLDVQLMCTNEGYLDYICPQVYFGYNNQSLPFLPTVSRWAALSTSCDLIVGLGFYKAGSFDTFAGTGDGEWQASFDIVARQYLDSLEISNCVGVAFYRYESIFFPPADVEAFAALERYNLQQVI